ncbi:MAG: hypothetical protein EOP11_00475 [Proteobacteria bacterium]|nr:MAG: hypothetical protein EOP11_00475 [Pseudomonadota bacterium]
MKFFALALLSLGFTAPAHAEKITCTFTEPFISTVIDTQKNTVSETWERTQSFRVLKKSEKRGAITLSYGRIGGERHVITYKRDWKGSDGMSDLVYPFSATRDKNLFGGCQTEKEKALNPNADGYGYGYGYESEEN